MDEWYTPPRYLELARAVMGGIDLDPFSSDAANQTVQADRYFTQRRSAFEQEWGTDLNLWANPPYSFPLVERCVDALIEHRTDIRQAIILTNAVIATEWAKRLRRASSAWCLCNHRIRFLNADGSPSGAPRFENIFYFWGSNVDRFIDVFQAVGDTMPLKVS